MPVIPVYALAAATQVPPLIAGAAQPLLRRTDGTPTTGPTLAAGDTTRLLTQFGNLSETTDILGRFGGGAYGIPVGVELSASGTDLTLNVSAGTAMLDGPVPVAAQSLGVTAGVYSWLWVTQAGALILLTGSNPNLVPAAPAPICAFLGRIDATGGVISSIDYSGRLSLRPLPWRQTGDFGTPGDSPPATFAFFHRTASGFYVWDGVAYTFLGTTASAPTNIGISSLLVQLGAVATLQDTADARFRRLLFHYVNTLGEIPPGLENEFALAAAQA